mgnify:CR=1 FL=1
MSDEQKKTEQAPKSETALEIRARDGALINYDYGEFAGVGSNDLPTSGFLPYLTVLAPLSKACQEGNEKYVPGAKPGAFLLGGAEQRVFDGKKGVIFVPIHDRHLIIEKTKLDGTGETVNRFDGDPKGPVATAMRQKFGADKSKWRSDAGNFMIDRHDVTGVLFESVEDVAAMKPLAACIVGFERTKMRAYGKMADGFNKFPAKQRPPLFALMTRLTINLEKGEHDYYNINLSFPVQDDFARSLLSPKAEMFRPWAEQCMKVIEALGSGTLQAGEAQEEADGGSGAGGSADGGAGKGTRPF